MSLTLYNCWSAGTMKAITATELPFGSGKEIGTFAGFL